LAEEVVARKAAEEHLKRLKLLEERDSIAEVEIVAAVAVAVAIAIAYVVVLILVGGPMGKARPQEMIAFPAKSGTN
jgi:hypothetical protein